ncbi:putative ankyrin repeat protein RF_0381 [Cotesia glomerata]|uniref:putative ankyrin repeat protein RF_0381 n=1 Tax=Cotesia glomerata TaxID=32391 RepID=UPI001D029B82|nr:putative ankyrin repeat protein RF_0381 [Cotesia glomerata]
MNKGANIHKSFETYGSALHVAVYKATWNLQIIDRLIQAGAPIDAREFSRQWTPLHVACSLGRADIVMLLLTRGADINAKISSGSPVRLPPGDTPLHVAIEFNQEKIVELLCRCRADVNSASVYRGTPLPFAVAVGNFKIVQLLIKYGANIDFVSTIQGNAARSSIFGAEGVVSLTALHVAVNLQNKEMVEILLINGAATDMSVGTFGTPLYSAVQGVESKIVHHLLNAEAGTKILRQEKLAIQKLIRENHPVNKSASIMFCDKNNSNLLTLPITDITQINLGVARYLLERRLICVDTLIGGKNLPVYEPTLLHVAIWNADEKLFHYLMNKGANIHKSFETYGSALHVAVYKATWNLRIIDRLIQAGVPINAREFSRQWTPLHVACYLGRDDIVMLLLTHGTEVNSTINSRSPVRLPSGETPLHVAIEFNQEKIVELLCRCKVGINLASVYRGTPLSFAVAVGNFKIVQLLINCGADVDYVFTIQGSAARRSMLSAEGDISLTALHVAVNLQNIGMVEILLINGAAIDMSVGTFGTPLYSVVQHVDSKIVHHLLNAGASDNILRQEKLAIQNLIRKNHPDITSLSPDISSFIYLTRSKKCVNPMKK